MNALSRFEEFVEKIVEGSIIGLLGAQLQPVELARRLARAMEYQRTIGVGKAFAPNDYVIFLSPEDMANFEPIKGGLQRELAAYVGNLAAERQLVLLAPPSVRLEVGERIGRRQIQVEARMMDSPPSVDVAQPAGATERFSALPAAPRSPVRAPGPSGTGSDRPRPQDALPHFVLRSADAAYPVDRRVIHFGRALDNDVVLEDSRVSRYHAEVRVERGRCRLRDLRSTNGTFVNGEQVGEALLRPGDIVSLGGVELRFESPDR